MTNRSKTTLEDAEIMDDSLEPEKLPEKVTGNRVVRR